MKTKTKNPLAKKKAGTGKQKKYSYLITGEELMLLPPMKKLPCLWEPYFPQQDIISLTGSSDVGKSSFLRQFALSVALKEKSFLGNPLNVRYGRALYLATEDNRNSIQFSFQNSIDPNLKPSQLKGLCYLVNPDYPFKAIEEQLKVAKTDVVIIDSFGDVFRGNLNDNNNVRTELNKYQKLSIKYDTLFMFLHHIGKGKESNNPSKNNVLGSQGYESKMRLVMELRRLDGSKKRILYFTKGNQLSEVEKSKSLELDFDNRQRFQLIGTGSIPNAGTNARHFTDEEKAQILSVAEPLRKQGLSYAKICVEVMSQLGISISQGNLYNWLKGKVVHSEDVV